MAPTTTYVESNPKTWSEGDYKRLLDELSPIFLSVPGDPDFDRSLMLVDLIEAYESEAAKHDDDFIPSVEDLAEYAATKRDDHPLVAA